MAMWRPSWLRLVVIIVRWILSLGFFHFSARCFPLLFNHTFFSSALCFLLFAFCILLTSFVNDIFILYENQHYLRSSPSPSPFPLSLSATTAIKEKNEQFYFVFRSFILTHLPFSLVICIAGLDQIVFMFCRETNIRGASFVSLVVVTILTI